MKKLLFWALTALVIVACGSKTAKAESSSDSLTANSDVAPDENYVPQRSDYTFRTEVRAINDDGDVRWDTIVVYLKDARGHTQELYTQALPLDTLDWNRASIGEIKEDDWNFDGIPDLQVCTGPMNGFGNFTYDVWLWDDQAHQFVEVEDCSGIFDPYIDEGNKCIVSNWRLDDEVEIHEA